MKMRIYDDTYLWEGWGGRLQLGSGKCHLRIFDQNKSGGNGVAHLRPIIVVVSDLTESSMSVRSCAGHIATTVVRDFRINPQRMTYVEYYAPSAYGEQTQYHIAERYDAVEFTWVAEKAVKPIWRSLMPPLRETVAVLIHKTDA